MAEEVAKPEGVNPQISPSPQPQPAFQVPLPFVGAGLQAIQIQQQMTLHQGPLPPPEQLKQYADLVPDLPERWMRLFEEQTRHRMGMESGALRVNEERLRKAQEIEDARDRDNYSTIRRAQVGVIALIVLLVIAVVWLAHSGQQLFAGVLIVLAGTVGVLLRHQSPSDFLLLGSKSADGAEAQENESQGK